MKTHQKEQKVIKLRYSREKKETDENVSTSKENKDKVINNKGNKVLHSIVKLMIIYQKAEGPSRDHFLNQMRIRVIA